MRSAETEAFPKRKIERASSEQKGVSKENGSMCKKKKSKENSFARVLRKRRLLFCNVAQSVLLSYPDILRSGDLRKVSDR